MKDKPFAIFQELESDDEFPETYKDVSIPPAYLNDNRFDEIKFPWVNVNLSFEGANPKTHLYESENQIYDEILYREGVLKGQDLYCLHSIESYICNRTFIWFLNFLLHKDVHSHYNYLKSCLVNDLISNIPFTTKKYDSSVNNVNIHKHRFEIIIKG